MAILQETPDLASLEILRRVREVGYEGGKTALYALVASLRPKPAKPLVRFEGLPGEFSQHDFGQVEMEFLNGASLADPFLRLSSEVFPIHTPQLGSGRGGGKFSADLGRASGQLGWTSLAVCI